MTHFFSCDWGTTTFRLRRVDVATGEVTGERRENTGVKSLFAMCPPDDRAMRESTFANFMREELRLLARGDMAALNEAAVYVSGMASSSVGWRELPYARVPIGLDGRGIVQEVLSLTLGERDRAHVHLISGIRDDTDIMRGEETEILGIFADGRQEKVAENGIVVLPGTHSKHVRLNQARITGFRTYMTGELFAVLSEHSLLRVSVQSETGDAGSTLDDPHARKAFAEGVRQSSAQGLAGSLFQTRVRTVLENALPRENRWFLSGLLIGSELVALAKEDSSLPVLLAAPDPLSFAYRLAFELLGMDRRVSVVPPNEMALASMRGHRALLALCSKPVPA